MQKLVSYIGDLKGACFQPITMSSFKVNIVRGNKKARFSNCFEAKRESFTAFIIYIIYIQDIKKI